MLARGFAEPRLHDKVALHVDDDKRVACTIEFQIAGRGAHGFARRDDFPADVVGITPGVKSVTRKYTGENTLPSWQAPRPGGCG